MFVIGFLLYQRGYELLSFDNLIVAVMLILTFYPKLIFSYGLWLSVFGVFYILLFFHRFKNLSNIKQFFLIPIVVYILMTPISLYLFENFSLYHPLSIFLTIGFSVFYPISLFLHFIGFGDLLDNLLKTLITLDIHPYKVEISSKVMALYLFLSLLSVKSKKLFFLTLLFGVFIISYGIISYFF